MPSDFVRIFPAASAVYGISYELLHFCCLPKGACHYGRKHVCASWINLLSFSKTCRESQLSLVCFSTQIARLHESNPCHLCTGQPHNSVQRPPAALDLMSLYKLAYLMSSGQWSPLRCLSYPSAFPLASLSFCISALTVIPSCITA